MPTPQDDLEALRQQVAALTARIFRLEQRLGIAAEAQRPEAAPPIAPPAAATSAPATSGPPPASGRTIAPPSFAQVNAGSVESASLESKIGKVWFNRIGIVAILLGVSWFLKYAFDNGWIKETGRVAIGLVAGILVLLWSERFRSKGHVIFSHSLKAVGIGVLYLSLWGAHHFNLVPVSVTFAAMIIVTASTVTLAVNQDAQIVAAYALVGGFLTPVLLSTGKNEEVILFTYVAILDLGVLALATLKPWRRLLWGSFLGTICLYIGWFDEFYSRSQRPLTIFFTGLFAAIFAAIPLVTPYRRSKIMAGPSITLTLVPLLNAAVLFLALYSMYYDETVKLTWFALGLAAIYLGISNLFMRRFAGEDTGKVIGLLHVTIAIAFITIAIPLKLNAHWITIGWLVESAVLLWIAERTKTVLLRYLGTAALVMGIFRVVVFDSDVATTRLIFNARFATYAVAIAVLSGIVIFGNRMLADAEGGKAALGPTERLALRVASITLNLLALAALTLEAHDYFTRQWGIGEMYGRNPQLYAWIELAEPFSYSLIWLFYGVGLMVTGFWKRSSFVRWQALVLIAFTIGKIFTYDSSELDKGYRILSFIALGVVLLGISYAYQRDWLKLSPRASEKAQGTSA